MAAGAAVVLAGYLFRLVGVALFGLGLLGSVALLVVNVLIFVAMITFVVACATWILKMGATAAR